MAVADTPELRSRGLMHVTELGDVRGMLFVHTDDSTSTFHMRDTVIALDIAFFREDGSLVSQASMVPCAAAPCDRYHASGPYRYALETVVGGFEGIDPLTLDPNLSDG